MGQGGQMRRKGSKINKRSGIRQGLVLGQALFKVFVGNMNSEIECTLNNFANDIRLCDVLDTLKGRDAIQKDLYRLERWACANLKMFNKPKCKVLHMGQGNPKPKYMLGGERIESNPEEKDLGVLVDKKVNTTSYVHSQPRNPTISWAASKQAWPAGQGW